MADREFLALSSLFDAIGIIEKGIERIYHYLLKHKRIDNLTEVSTEFNLTLKRGYKICAVLNDLERSRISSNIRPPYENSFSNSTYLYMANYY